jgi:hypothetical protein
MLWLQDKMTKSVRRYVWNHQPEHSWGFLGVYHSVETAFIHNTPIGFLIYPKVRAVVPLFPFDLFLRFLIHGMCFSWLQYFTPEEASLAAKVGDLWTRFILDEITEEEWPLYKAGTEDYLSIGDHGPNIVARRGYRLQECEFWDNAYPEVRYCFSHTFSSPSIPDG